MPFQKLRLKVMGVINITPDSFSDGGEISNSTNFLERVTGFGRVSAVDIGAESTAPQNQPITWQEEWARWQTVIPHLNLVGSNISADTYHIETIMNLVKIWKDQKLHFDLYWNDVSGIFDDSVKDFLNEGKRFHYIYCHNRVPKRELTSDHMSFMSKQEGRLLEEFGDHFGPRLHDRVIFDPCLGFAKSYDENWYILNHFPYIQSSLSHDRWLLGFSRKSFMRKKFGTQDRAELDRIHGEVLSGILPRCSGELWIRTHRPELLLPTFV